MKRTLAFLLAVVMLLALAACGQTEAKPAETKDEAPAEETKDEAPAEEAKDEAPAEEAKDEAPAEEAKDEAPAEENKDEAPAEEAKEETPTEETKDEAPAEEAKEEAPAEENKDEAPAEENKDEAPAEENKDEAPAEEEAPVITPVEGFSGMYLMGTGSATGNYYNFGNAVCTVVNQATGANITVNATGGSTENARLLGDGENEFAMIQSDVFSYAHQGIELFDGDPITNFKAVTACYPEMVQIVVRKDSGIQSVADMAGKNICVGAVGSGYEVAARQILGAYGMTYDDINETFADQATAKNGVQDGTFDGMFLCSGYPNGNVSELSLTGKIEVLTIDQEHLDILTAQYPFYSPFTTETDEYNLGHEITSVAVKCMLVCSDTFTEDEIYALTKAIYENLPSIKEINKKANYMSLEDALSGIPSDLHPGAARYFTEQGIEIPEYLK